jgi:hypothetical protein
VRRAIQRRLPGLAKASARLVRFQSGQFTDNLEWHRHYRLSELRRMLERDFTIRTVYRGGLWLYPVTAATISVIGRLSDNQALLKRLFQLLNWDFRLRAGPLSYNLMMLAQRRD